MTTRYAVTGGGGFIGHNLIKRLKADGHWVRGVDVKYPEFESSPADEFKILDLRDYENCKTACSVVEGVFHLAASMGGIGFISSVHADVARTNVLIDANMLDAARHWVVKKFLFSSSACVYAQGKQHDVNVLPLREEDAYPADPEPGYGWEKLFAEQLCEYFRTDHKLDVRVVRFHNVYGPLGTYDGGKEKAPAAICRKVAMATDEIEIWGDGQQTRSFMYVDDCVEGMIRLMASDYTQPLNLGTDELISINGLVEKVCGIAGKTLTKKHDTSKPQGVRGRNSDNNKLREVLNWEPTIKLDEGLRKTYDWVLGQVCRADHFYYNSVGLRPDDLVFDIGANVGNKTEVFTRMGCRVISVEPQAACLDHLRTKFEKKKVTIVPYAMGETITDGSLMLGYDLGCASMNMEWVQSVRNTNRFGDTEGAWTKREPIGVTTLDKLIGDYGVPKFIKIDIEGSEHFAIAGLSQPVDCSFEFHPEYLSSTEKCVRRLEILGPASFNYSLKESLEMASPDWLSGTGLLEALRKYQGDNQTYGDCYVRFN